MKNAKFQQADVKGSEGEPYLAGDLRSTYISKTLSFLAAWAAISPRAVVLDIGCGTGGCRLSSHSTLGVCLSEALEIFYSEDRWCRQIDDKNS